MYTQVMNIEHDPNKARLNEVKHGISFDEAATALLDGNALSIEDNDSQGENRWVLIGMSEKVRLITVVYTLRGETIRLISARKATRKEARNYA